MKSPGAWLSEMEDSRLGRVEKMGVEKILGPTKFAFTSQSEIKTIIIQEK